MKLTYTKFVKYLRFRVVYTISKLVRSLRPNKFGYKLLFYNTAFMLTKIITVILIVLLFSVQTFAQISKTSNEIASAKTSLAGRWLGTITQTGTNKVASDYYFELNLRMDSITTNNTNTIEGTSYSYIRKEGGKYILKAVISATFKNNELIFKELAMLAYENSIQKHADYCVKIGNLQFSETQSNGILKALLKGTWNGKEHKTNNPCAGGAIYLEKFLPDTTNGVTLEDEKITKLQDRIIKKGKTITVHSTTLKIEIFDDADEDDDMISLNFNGKWLIQKYKLKNKSLLRTIVIDAKNPFNYITTLAHNLGKMPPNTTALIIDDGKKKQKVVLKSDMDSSDVLYLEYEQGK